VDNDYLHRFHPRIEQDFVPVSNADRVEEGDRMDLLVKAILGPNLSSADLSAPEGPAGDGDGDNDDAEQAFNVDNLVYAHSQPIPQAEELGAMDEANSAIEQTMVFVNTAEAAQALARALYSKGIQCVEFHKKISSISKQNNLQAFRSGRASVIVCTDHASRGLDLPSVKHVIQAEFAENVVQYLHRIGRASRGGSTGRATNFYSEESKDLVYNIMQSSALSEKEKAAAADGAVGSELDLSFGQDHGDEEGTQRRRQRVHSTDKIDTSMGGQGSLEQSFSRRRGLRRRVKRSIRADEAADEARQEEQQEEQQFSRPN
jgi:superfamily II DNA/RNA helicase